MSPVRVKKTESAGGVVLNKKGEVLVVSQHGNSWSLPKGHIDPGESALKAAKREIKEEAGVGRLKLIKELGRYSRYRIGRAGKREDRSELKTIHLFLFKTSQTKLKPLDPNNPEAKWVKREKVAALLTHSKDRNFFRKILKEL